MKSEIKYLKKHAVLIGSKLFDESRGDDWDFVIPIESFSSVVNSFIENDYILINTGSGYKSNVEYPMKNVANAKVKSGSSIIDLIAYSKEDLPKVIAAKKDMVRFIDSLNSSDRKLFATNKGARVSVFNFLLMKHLNPENPDIVETELEPSFLDGSL